MGSTNLTATLTDSTGQLWVNGSYSISFVPTPGIPGPFYWNGEVFEPEVYTGQLSDAGVLVVTLPDNFTITPSGSQWAFVLCANTSAPCTRIVVPVTGASEDLSALFSSRIVPPILFSTPVPRAYSSAEIYTPPPNQGGLFYQVLDNLLYFWNGTEWVPLNTSDGTVTSVGLALPSIFDVSGSPVTGSGTLAGTLVDETANTVFAGPASGAPAVPTFRALTEADISGLLPSLFYQTVASNGTAETQRPTLNFSPNFALTDSASPAETTADLLSVGTAGTYASPSSVTTDTKGRVTAITAGTNEARHTVTGSRSLGVQYPNPSTVRAMKVAVSIYLTGTYGEDSSIAGSIGPSGSLTYASSGSILNAGGKATLWIEVPVGEYYEVAQDNQYLTNPQTPNISTWDEYY